MSNNSHNIVAARFFSHPQHERAMRTLIHLPQVLVEHWLVQGESLAGLADQSIPFPRDPLVVALEAEAAPHAGQEPEPEPPQIEGPRSRSAPLQAASLEERVVDLRMQGKHAHDIARLLDVDTAEVAQIVQDAREKGGIQFPKKEPKPDVAGVNVFHTDLKFMPMGSRSKLTKVAVDLGMSLEELVKARAKFVKMRKAKKGMDEIAQATRIPEKMLWTWLYKARAAGIKLPLDVGYTDAQVRPVLPIRRANAPIRLKTYAQFVAEKSGAAIYKMETAAKARGVTMAEYEYLREVVLDMAIDQKMAPVAIAEAVGEPPHFVSSILHYAHKSGVHIPGMKINAERYQPKPETVADKLLATLKPFDQLPTATKRMMLEAAARRQISIETWTGMRERVIRLRLDGLNMGQIARELQIDKSTVGNWINHAQRMAGVNFPPVGEVRDAHSSEPLAAE